jgi:hypothetical protein
MRVMCYFNLHKRCFSLKALEGPNKGRVVAHADHVLLTDVVFKVSEAGRQRVIREKRKNVHAGVVGEWLSQHNPHITFVTNLTPITYNPYKHSTFVKRGSETPVRWADTVIMSVDEQRRPTTHAINAA